MSESAKRYEDFVANDKSVPFRNKNGEIDMIEIPQYWKGGVDDIDETIKLVKKGKAEVLCKSAGGRDVFLVSYGNKNNLKRTANYSSALGGGSLKCYADKTGEEYVPTVCIIGATHGGEFEGTVAINNLIKNIETGTDYNGDENKELIEALEGINLLLVPCLNIDGRARIPLRTMVGQTFDKFRYYSQGSWMDGELCGHPACKLIHPIKDKCDFLGGYFNDDGVNIVHDNFFFPMAEETKAILKLADEFVPDITIHLHGGSNNYQQFFEFNYMPRGVKERIRALNDFVDRESKKRGMGDMYFNRPVEAYEDTYESTPPSFNIQSAWTALCGEPCIVYESNQGLYYEEGRYHFDLCFDFDDIYNHHKLLFECTGKFVKDLYKK